MKNSIIKYILKILFITYSVIMIVLFVSFILILIIKGKTFFSGKIQYLVFPLIYWFIFYFLYELAKLKSKIRNLLK